MTSALVVGVAGHLARVGAGHPPCGRYWAPVRPLLGGRWCRRKHIFEPRHRRHLRIRVRHLVHRRAVDAGRWMSPAWSCIGRVAAIASCWSRPCHLAAALLVPPDRADGLSAQHDPDHAGRCWRNRSAAATAAAWNRRTPPGTRASGSELGDRDRNGAGTVGLTGRLWGADRRRQRAQQAAAGQCRDRQSATAGAATARADVRWPVTGPERTDGPARSGRIARISSRPGC